MNRAKYVRLLVLISFGVWLSTGNSSPPSAAPQARVPDDSRLVKDCLAGSEEAWALLIEKYKSLIYSIPVKYGLPPQEAADIFQTTCLELLVRLGELSEVLYPCDEFALYGVARGL